MTEQILKHELLQDYYTIEQAKVLQFKWFNIKEKLEKESKYESNIEKIKWVAGVDVSFPKEEGPKWGLACAVLWDYKNNKMIQTAYTEGELNFPYKAGFLGFRENRLIAKSILKLSKKPDVIMCDGHGLIHPRKFGEAVHLGVALDIPSFGVAKRPLIGFSNWKSLNREKGNLTPVWENEPSKNGTSAEKILGKAICLTENCAPVFVSVGYKISLENAIKIALDTSINHPQPEPIYLADIKSREEIEKVLSKQS